MSPRFIRLSGKQGQVLSQTIKIIPLKEFPFTIKKVKAHKGEHLRFELKPLHRKEDPQGYQLVVTNTMEAVGNYQDAIIIETDSKVKPEFKIPVYGRIDKASPQARKQSTQ